MFPNDEYTLDIDDLGYKQQADNIRKLIIESDTPYSIGISGRWGSGKSSMMKYIMASLGGTPLVHRLKFQTDYLENKQEKENYDRINKMPEYNNVQQIQTIWFNPWEHENHDEPLIELLKEIKRHFELMSTMTDEVKKLSVVAIQAGLDMLGSFLKTGSNQGTNIKNIGEKYEYDTFDYETRSQRFKLIFEKAIEKLLTPSEKKFPDEKAKLVIFIDDLDRCEQETISKLLRDIKQYLSTKRCVFVFGYDRHHVERALSASNSRTVKEIRAYFDKLFQSTVYVKQPTGLKIKEFIFKYLEIEKFNFVDQSNYNELVNYISCIIDPNPRRIKSFITSYYFHVKNSYFSKATSINLDDLKKLALITYLKLFYESVYTALENKNEILINIVSVFKTRSRLSSSNYSEYYLYLEFRSHINDLDVGIDKDMIDKEFINDESSERKLLTEVYDMQGRHKSFECYMNEFIEQFQKIATDGLTGEINAYL